MGITSRIVISIGTLRKIMAMRNITDISFISQHVINSKIRKMNVACLTVRLVQHKDNLKPK